MLVFVYMCTSQVQGGATNAAPQWTTKLGLPLRTTYTSVNVITIDTLIRTALDCGKDFRNLLNRKLNEIEEKESILFQRFLLQQ